MTIFNFLAIMAIWGAIAVIGYKDPVAAGFTAIIALFATMVVLD